MQENCPTSFGGIWNRAFSIWWRHKGFFLLVAALGFLPEALSLVARGAPLQILNLLLMPLTMGMVAAYTSRILEDDNASAAEASSRALSRYLPLFWTGLIYYLIVVVGFICLIIPGILWAFTYGLSLVATMVEHKSGNAALERSKQLVKADRSLAANVMVGIPLLLGLGMFSLSWVGSVGAFAVSPSLVLPVMLGLQFVSSWLGQAAGVSFVVLFYSLRQRQDGEAELSGVGFSRF